MKAKIASVKTWLQSLSFRTGTIVLLLCVPCYIFSFAQVLLPIDAATKGILWFIFFGLAKTFQYAGLTILGIEGYRRVKKLVKSLWKKEVKTDKVNNE